MAATGAGRSLFFAMERGRPWQVPAEDAHRLLLDFAQAPGYLETVQAAMVDVPTRLERITCPVLLLQGTADPLVSMQSPRFLAFVRHAQLPMLVIVAVLPVPVAAATWSISSALFTPPPGGWGSCLQ